MRKKSNNNFLFMMIILLLLGIGLGYAIIHSDLILNGTANIGSNTWDIHFENVQVATGSVTATTPATINPSDNTKINYAVLLNKPGDYYEFTVDMVNAGTLPGKITLVELNGITSSLEDIIDYSIVYTNTNNPVAVNDILNASSSKNIKVRVYYKEDIEEDDLLTSNANLNITVNITFNQSDEEEVTTNTIIQQLKNENSSCFTKYNGQVTDQVGQTVTAQNVYFNRCADKRNIKFNNMCWQMIRTTETGGIKMIYNGEPDNNGKCSSSRGDHKGIVQSGLNYQNLASSYLYGTSFTYDTSNNTFTLKDTSTATWNDSTYEDLIGKFTCKNTTGTCTTLYNVNGYESTRAYTSSYTIGDTNYAQIGASSFNASPYSLAMVGYMFNKAYNYKSGDPASDSLMGNDVSYSNGTYTLLPASGESELGTTEDATHHYTCNNTTGICSKVRYYYYSSGSSNYYIELDGEANIDEAINNMLYNNNVNRYNSSIKGIIDAWYAQNLSSKANMLEDTVYCNARNMINQATNGWNKDGDLSILINFKNYTLNNDLSCINVTDQFAVSNNKAKLTYPVALLEDEERYNINTSSLMATGVYWWGLSPYIFGSNAGVRYVLTAGDSRSDSVLNPIGSRPVVSLNSGTVITGGDGSEESPWVIE